MEDAINSTDMGQEVVPKSLAFMSASNKPSNVMYFQESWNLMMQTHKQKKSSALSNGFKLIIIFSVVN